MDRRRDGVARRRRTSLDVESRHRKMIHASTRPPTRRCVRGCFSARCHRRVDRPHAPRNQRFPVGEELAGKSSAARRSGGGGFREENKVTGMKYDHRKSKLGFPFGFDTM